MLVIYTFNYPLLRRTLNSKYKKRCKLRAHRRKELLYLDRPLFSPALEQGASHSQVHWAPQPALPWGHKCLQGRDCHIRGHRVQDLSRRSVVTRPTADACYGMERGGHKKEQKVAAPQTRK